MFRVFSLVRSGPKTKKETSDPVTRMASKLKFLSPYKTKAFILMKILHLCTDRQKFKN